MHVEIIPPQLPLTNGQSFAERQWPSVQRAREIVAEAQVPVHGMIRVGRDAASGISEAARENKVSAIVLGWRPGTRTRDRLLGPTLDPVLADPTSDVLVLRAGSIGEPRRVLVPLAGGPNATLALAYALQLAEVWDATVTALTIVSTSAARRSGRSPSACCAKRAKVGPITRVCGWPSRLRRVLWRAS